MLPYHIERARKKWQRQMRVASAIALFGLSACSADSASSFFTWEDEVKTTLNVKVQALDGVSQKDADALADALRKEIEGQETEGGEINAVMGASRKPDGLYVITIVDLKDKSGVRINRVVDEKLVQAGPGLAIPPAEWQRVAQSATAQLMPQTSGASGSLIATAPLPAAQGEKIALKPAADDAALTTASIAPATAPEPKVLSAGDPHDVPDFGMADFRINMGPTPGDGSPALTQALSEALKDNPKARGVRGQYRIDGTLHTESAENGEAAISIEWQISTSDGRKLGAVTQKNSLPPERIAGRWNEVAENAGKAAAEGVLTLLDARAPRS